MSGIFTALGAVTTIDRGASKMDSKQLRQRIADYRKQRQGKESKMQFANENGPISTTELLWVADVVEALEARIAELEKNAGASDAT